VIAAVSLLAAAPAVRGAARVRLAYERGPGAERCADGRAFTAAVAARLGYDPFVAAPADAPAGAVSVHLGARRGALVARVALRDAAGALVGERTLRGEGGLCAELVATTALAVALALDPDASRGPPGPSGGPRWARRPGHLDWAAPSRGLFRRDPEPSPPPPPPPAAWQWAWVLRAHAALGATPQVTGGLAVGVQARAGPLSLGVELRGDAPSLVRAGGGRVAVGALSLALVPCYRADPVALCGVVGAGAQMSEGHGVPGARLAATPLVSVGARVGARAPLSAAWALVAHLEATTPLVITVVRLGDAQVWRSPRVAGALAVGVQGRWP
jgi:hypothetical protein